MDESVTMNDAITYRHLQFNFVGYLFHGAVGSDGPKRTPFKLFPMFLKGCEYV